MRQKIAGNRRYLFLATVLAIAVPALWFTFIWVVAPGLPPVPTSTGPVPTPTDVAPSPPPVPTPTDPVPTPTDVAVAPSPAGADREALVALYQATDGTNWVNNANWLSDAPLDTWYGVTTDASGRVTALTLIENGLRGEIPSALGSLTNLTWLGLYNNELSGEIPSALGNLTNLTSLSLSGNRLSGEIPSALGDLTNLTTLGLWGNELSGAIPSALGNLTNLTTLNLSINELSGAIPPALGNLTNLTWLDMSENELSGAIPSALGNLTNLEAWYLSGNQLRGCVPAAWRNVEYWNDLDSLGLPFCAASSTTSPATAGAADWEALVAFYPATESGMAAADTQSRNAAQPNPTHSSEVSSWNLRG